MTCMKINYECEYCGYDFQLKGIADSPILGGTYRSSSPKVCHTCQTIFNAIISGKVLKLNKQGTACVRYIFLEIKYDKDPECPDCHATDLSDWNYVHCPKCQGVMQHYDKCIHCGMKFPNSRGAALDKHLQETHHEKLPR